MMWPATRADLRMSFPAPPEFQNVGYPADVGLPSFM